LYGTFQYCFLKFWIIFFFLLSILSHFWCDNVHHIDSSDSNSESEHNPLPTLLHINSPLIPQHGSVPPQWDNAKLDAVSSLPCKQYLINVDQCMLKKVKPSMNVPATPASCLTKVPLADIIVFDLAQAPDSTTPAMENVVAIQNKAECLSKKTNLQQFDKNIQDLVATAVKHCKANFVANHPFSLNNKKRAVGICAWAALHHDWSIMQTNALVPQDVLAYVCLILLSFSSLTMTSDHQDYFHDVRLLPRCSRGAG
jgi:hypothetical protein